MKCCKLQPKDIAGILIALASLTAVVLMLNAEVGVSLDAALKKMAMHGGITNPALATSAQITAAYQAYVLPNLQLYSLALGLLLLAVSIAYIMVGRSDDIVTSPDERK